jgi:hypothetical protein
MPSYLPQAPLPLFAILFSLQLLGRLRQMLLGIGLFEEAGKSK